MMKQHVYKFEFNYSRMVNGKKTKFVIPIVVHDVGYADACCRVDEHVKKNFADRVTEESTIKYVGEFVHGVFKTFVEVKEGTDVNRLYPQAVDVCKVYRIERDQALKENEAINKNRKLMRVDLENSEKMNRLLVKENEKLCENIRFMDKENWSLLNAVAGYKKELSQLNLLMDDMENRLEKQVVAREGMLKQLREYKAEKKRMNKIIDALTEDK